MSRLSRRLQTIQTLIAGSVLSHTANYPSISLEFDEVMHARFVIIRRRRHLLQIFHSCRAIDTALRAFLDHYGIRGRSNSLGRYLRLLTGHAHAILRRLPPNSERHYQRQIVSVRNHYAHTAGAYPLNEAELSALLCEIDTCLAEVLAL